MSGGHRHHHGHDGVDADVRVSRTARLATLVLLAVVAAITMAGLVWLWPTERVLPEGSVLTAEGIVPVRGQITAHRAVPGVPGRPARPGRTPASSTPALSPRSNWTAGRANSWTWSWWE